jgi:hypothetical protein
VCMIEVKRLIKCARNADDQVKKERGGGGGVCRCQVSRRVYVAAKRQHGLLLQSQCRTKASWRLNPSIEFGWYVSR